MLTGCAAAGKEALLPRHQRSSSQGALGSGASLSSIKAVHSRHTSPTRGSRSRQSPLRDTQHRLQQTHTLLDVLQFGQLHTQVGQKGAQTERFLIDVLAAQDYRNSGPTTVKQIVPLRKVPELQSILPAERRHPVKAGSTHATHTVAVSQSMENQDGALALDPAASVASVGLLDESQLQETAPVVRVSAELLRTQNKGNCSKPQPITM